MRKIFALTGLFSVLLACAAVPYRVESSSESTAPGPFDPMGSHMRMSAIRSPKSGDALRAENIVRTARKVLEKYTDYKTAVADGFQIFLPGVPQPMYHFTNYAYAREAESRFNPEHPTSLLFEKHGDDYKLVGAMYTAPAQFSEDDLDKRIPLSIAQWHQHINLCLPPHGREAEMLTSNPLFGLNGSLTTKADCDKASGTFIPRLFGWMVHVYPFEKTQAKIWSAERQMHDMSSMSMETSTRPGTSSGNIALGTTYPSALTAAVRQRSASRAAKRISWLSCFNRLSPVNILPL